MTEPNHPLNTLNDIKNIMERSSRFISLSGLSGISAGMCALAGAWFAKDAIHENGESMANLTSVGYDFNSRGTIAGRGTGYSQLTYHLLTIGIITFVAAFILAFIFTYLRSRRKGVKLWGKTSRRLFASVSVPVAVGGIYILKLMSAGIYGLIAPGCLIFYGLALVNAGKYTLSEIKYLGYCELILGLVNLLLVGYGLIFWALGFGVLHIIYGAAMWWRYERAGAEI
ncbi:MAG TPA: hypothetical protein VHB48_11000 [Chitinophagaceae bacterium]|nr:hypothetical protein [Chitinophagaceae bacterium]